MAKNLAPTDRIRMHGSYGIAKHDHKRAVKTPRRRWTDRMEAPFDPSLVRVRCS